MPKASSEHKELELRSSTEKLLEHASPLQAASIKLLNLSSFDYIMGVVIVFNMAVMIAETDRVAAGETMGGHWTEVCGWAILVVFLLELGLRLFAFRCVFWKDPWHVFDFAVVVTDGTFSLLGLVLGNFFPVSVLRVLRLAKLARISKVLRVFPELRIMVAGLAGSVSAIFWGFVLLCLLVLVWSIVAVQFVQPWNKDLIHDEENCPRCPRAYSTVMHSALTIWQTVIAGDNWGQTAVPIIENHPESALFFLGVCVSVGMGVLNLILGVVCNVFTLAHDRIQAEIVLEERIAKLESQQHLRRICESLDEEGLGELTMEQMKVGFDSHEDFHSVMDSLEVSADDLEIVWTIIDTEKSGAVSYQKFVDQVYLMKDNDTHFMLAYIKYYITKIKETLLTEIQSNKEAAQKAVELEAKMLEQVEGFEAEEKQVEQMMMTQLDKIDRNDEMMLTQLDKQATSIQKIETCVTHDVAAVGAPGIFVEKPQRQQPTQSGPMQPNTCKAATEEDEKSCDEAAQRQALRSAGYLLPFTKLDSSDTVGNESSQMLRRRLQNASSEIHRSLDKHISEIGVLIEEMLPGTSQERNLREL